MQITIDVSDLEAIWHSDCGYSEDFTGDRLREYLFNMAVEKYVEQLYNNEIPYAISETVNTLVKEEIDKRKADVIEKVIERVAEKVAAMKMVKEQMPKASEITAINKEWQEYFADMIDAALKKKFR